VPLAFRIIARLDIKPPWLIKTRRLEGVKKVGNPADYARRYDRDGIDEILYLDVVASLYGRNSLGSLLDDTTSDVFTPVTAGGGLRSAEDVRALLQHGADKVCINTALIDRPELVDEITQKFGAQVLTVQIDAKRRDGWWECLCDGGRQTTGRAVLDWAREVTDRGAGEILLTCVDTEGTGAGMAQELTEAVAALPIPVVAAGGFSHPDHATEMADAGASGIAISGALHYDRVALPEIREALRDRGYHVRGTHESTGDRS
jgi:cyclase